MSYIEEPYASEAIGRRGGTGISSGTTITEWERGEVNR